MKEINISHQIINQNDEIILDILDNQSGTIKIDWHDLPPSEKYHMIVRNNTSLDILELNEREAEVTFDIGDNVSIKLNIFNYQNGENVRRLFNIGENSTIKVAYADFSKGTKKLNVDAALNEKNSYLEWHLATLSEDDDRKIYVINFNHNAEMTTAKMENYGVAKDASTLQFLGDAKINRGAKKSKTNQIAKIMVFDDKVHAKASPMLCIDENDVEASHGASEGQINKEHVFYLMSRGISENEAKQLITYGYLYPIIQYFNDEKIKQSIAEHITKRV